MRQDINRFCKIGWNSIKDNRIPLFFLWALAFSLVLSYYKLPVAKKLLQPIFNLQFHGGWKAAVANRVVFCGLLPGIFLATVRSIRPRRTVATILANCMWMGLWGVLSNMFFTMQASIFGNNIDFTTILCKILVDKCIWSALLCVPLNSLFFFWEGCDLSLTRCKSQWPGNYIRNIYLPLLVTDFMVWIPVQCAVYMFPLPLQIQLVGFAGAFWTLVGLSTESNARMNLITPARLYGKISMGYSQPFVRTARPPVEVSL